VRRAFVTLLVSASTLSLAPAAHAARPTFPTALATSILEPSRMPAGANDPSCRPTARHPRPVVLLHGTYATPYNSFAALAPALRASGWCVFAPALGASPVPFIKGWQPIERSATQLGGVIDAVLATTGAEQVDLVGYSQGGVVARAYLTDPALGGARRARVHALVGLSVPNHGTNIAGLATITRTLRLAPILRRYTGQGALDLLAGSPLQRELTRRGETIPGVATTMVATATDEISVPSRAAWLAGTPDAPVRNVLLQRGCPIDLSDHFSIPYSPRAMALVASALAEQMGRSLPCTLQLPVV
jgi:triacylglycerol esterase/lipase EstA (alpha/beta hydrolase family)